MFGRKKDEAPVDMNDRSPQLGIKYKDLVILGQLMQLGADLDQAPARVVLPIFQ